MDVGFLVPKVPWGEKRNPERLVEDNHPPWRRQDANNVAGTDGHMEDSLHKCVKARRGVYPKNLG